MACEKNLATLVGRMVAIQTAIQAAGQNFDCLMQTVVDGALTILDDADGALVEMRDHEERVCRAASGIAAPFVGFRRRLSGTLFEQCMTSGEVQLCADVEQSDYVDIESCRIAGIGSMIIAPVRDRGEVTGVVKIFSRRHGAFGVDDLPIAQILAGAITSGIARMERDAAYRERDKMAARFRATFDQAAVGIAHVSIDGAFLRVNDRFCAIAGHDRDILLRSGFQKITHPADLAADLEYVGQLVRGEIASYSMEKRYVRSDYSLAWINLTVSLVRDPASEADFFVAVIEDISARKTAEEKASRDPLTGLRNRRWLDDNFERIVAKDGGRGTVLAYLDVDGFKAVNDRFGHAEGDRCLIDIVACFEQMLRSTDIACRIAGDEFVLVMPDTTRASALRVIDQVCRAAEELCITRPWTIGMSAGAILVKAGQEPALHEVLEAADGLMYRAKRASGQPVAILELDKATAALAATLPIPSSIRANRGGRFGVAIGGHG